MKVEITDKNDVRIDGKTYIQGTVVDKEEDEATKQAWVQAGIAKSVENTKPVKENV